MTSPRHSARLLGWSGAQLIRVFGATWRLRFSGELSGSSPRLLPHIYALMHGQLLLPSFRMRKSGAVVMISRHADGEIIARAVERLGYATVRGSSTRGASGATAELIRRHGDRPWIVTPDGPKGPRGSVKPGLVRLAAATGRAVYPVAGAARPAKRFASWDRFTLPLPLARVAVHVGEPVRPSPEPGDADCAALAALLQERLAAAEKSAVAAVASW